MTIKDFTKYFESMYPLKGQEEWDNCGLLYGNPKKVVNNIVVALDLTTEVMNEAIKVKADLIITHHPFIFGGSKEDQLIEAPYKASLYKRLDNTGIAVYAAHTSFDNANGGMADTFIETLGFKPKKFNGSIYGRMFDHTTNAEALKDLMTKKIGIQTFISNIGDANDQYSRIVVLPGSGATPDIIAAAQAGAGVIITSDVKWNQWVTIKELGIRVIQVTHAMEDVFTQKVADLLKDKFKDINVKTVFVEEIAK